MSFVMGEGKQRPATDVSLMRFVRPWHGEGMTTRYSRRPNDVAAARAFLLTTLDRPDDQVPRYGEVAAVISTVPRAVAPVLNSIYKECDERWEPDLSSLVVWATAVCRDARRTAGRSEP